MEVVRKDEIPELGIGVGAKVVDEVTAGPVETASPGTAIEVGGLGHVVHYLSNVGGVLQKREHRLDKRNLGRAANQSQLDLASRKYWKIVFFEHLHAAVGKRGSVELGKSFGESHQMAHRD